jgi:hypothetical protein
VYSIDIVRRRSRRRSTGARRHRLTR